MQSRSVIVGIGVLALAVCCALQPAALAAADEPDDALQPAKDLFERYATLEEAFDPAMADLYSDDAVIKMTRHYPTGEVREAELSGSQLKALLRQTMPLAKARGDRNSYSDVAFSLGDDGRLAIDCSRYSYVKNYTSPMRVVLAQGEGGEWLIVEQHVESRP